MKRKRLLALFLLTGVGVLAACSAFSNVKKNVPETSHTEKKVNSDSAMRSLKEKEKLYDDLASNANSPKMLKYSDQFKQKISFVAQVEGEPKQVKSKDDSLNGEWYVSVLLMRNKNTPIYLNLSDIKKKNWPKNDDILRIEGTPIGYLYTSYNNERLDLLDMKASALEVVNVKNESVSSDKVIETNQYKVEITAIDLLQDAFEDPSLVVYYNFKNKKGYRSVSPLKNYFYFSQKKKRLETTILNVNNNQLDSKAINRDTLEPGEEMLYYEAFKLLDLEEKVYLDVFDDEYNLLNTLELSVPGAK
ncbi:DUF5067 domain-containing protein [Enterococcus quebecensis]|uniref:DUF5067 domain-containing protein n=1 Tax=Enterococcus quebecensis TaxID=903983 RepID=A0A1E5H2Y8_9ENTE|nr:DUF5067 domain-containing protein [Enterococcus quebecensis]OEG19244.1 hypothetical protein BCR23_00710 [Enterococcus quebecensis]